MKSWTLIIFTTALLLLGQKSQGKPSSCYRLRILYHLYEKGIPVNAKDAMLKYNCPYFEGLGRDYSNGGHLFPNARPTDENNEGWADTSSYYVFHDFCHQSVDRRCEFRLYTTNPNYVTKKSDVLNPIIKDEMVIDYKEIARTDIVHLDGFNFKSRYFKLVYSADTTVYIRNYLQYGRNFKSAKLIEIDSCILKANTFNLNEKIEFTAKVAATRQVETMSCSCGNTNFYYKVYSLEKDGWKLFIDHTEEGKYQCECIWMRAKIINGNKYSIQPIKKPGTYYIEIKGEGFVINSMTFTVKE